MVILLSGCQSFVPSSSVGSGDEPMRSSSPSSETASVPSLLGEFPFGLSPSELVALLNQKGIPLLDKGSYEVENPIEDGRCYDAIGHFSYYTKDVVFVYDSDSQQMISIDVLTKSYASDQGICVGDPLSKVTEVYDKADLSSVYEEYPCTGYEYKLGNLFLLFQIESSEIENPETDAIWRWSISVYPIGESIN